MARLEGTVALSGLPPHRGLIVSLCLYRVSAATDPPPHNGDPPADAVTDAHEVCKNVDLNAEWDAPSYDLPFALERDPGCYYLQVRCILFRSSAEGVFAQVEPFFFARRPLVLTETGCGITLPLTWPADPLDELHKYGEIHPQKK